VIDGAAGRRRWSADDRARILEETLVSGAVVPVVDRRHGLTPQQLFKWRRDGCQFTATQEFGQCERVATVRLDPVAGLPRDQRGREHRTGMTEAGDEAVQAVAGRSRLVAKVQAFMLGGQAFDGRRMLTGAASISPR
jgi:transposase